MLSFKTLSLVAILLCVQLAVTAQNQIFHMQLKHRQAEDVMPLIEPHLLAGERLSGKQRNLYLTTTDERFVSLRSIILQEDVPLSELIIAVKRATEGHSSRQARQKVIQLRVLEGEKAMLSLGQQQASLVKQMGYGAFDRGLGQDQKRLQVVAHLKDDKVQLAIAYSTAKSSGTGLESDTSLVKTARLITLGRWVALQDEHNDGRGYGTQRRLSWLIRVDKVTTYER